MLSTYEHKKSLHVAKIITDLLPYYVPYRNKERLKKYRSRTHTVHILINESLFNSFIISLLMNRDSQKIRNKIGARYLSWIENWEMCPLFDEEIGLSFPAKLN